MKRSVQQPFDRDFWHITFDAPLEEQFNAHYAQELLPRIRMAALAGALMMLGHSALDTMMVAPDVQAQVIALRLVFIVLPLLLVYALASRPQWHMRMQALTVAACTSTGLAVVAVLATTEQSSLPLPYEGLMLALFFFYCCGGVRLKPITVVGWLVTVAYVVVTLWLVGLELQQVLERSVFLVTANLMGMVCCRTMELSARHNFWMQRQLDELARLDFLTGTFNRRALTDKLTETWQQARREQRPLNVALLDVDFFKRYNDHYGHPAGDTVLKQVAQVLQQLTRRPLDLCSRYGGEEFVCVWYGQTLEEMHALLARLHADIAALRIAHVASDIAVHLTVSVGMVQVLPSEASSPEEALKMADETLYAAKAQGRNRSVVQCVVGAGGERGKVPWEAHQVEASADAVAM